MIDPFESTFANLNDLERFYFDTSKDVTLRQEAFAFARANPAVYKRARYYVEPWLEEVQAKKRDVANYRFLFEVLGGRDKWRPQYQQRGTCVGQGAKLGADIVAAINTIFGGGRWKGRTSVAAAYAGSRVEIGKRPGNWDGSTGFWVVEFLKRFGVVFLKDLGLPDDDQRNDENLAIQWTASRSGVPADIEQLARETPVVESYVVETTAEAEVVLEAGGVILQCSNLIASGRRGAYGVSPLQRAGGHCQLTAAKFYPDGESRIWNQMNSWSANWGSGTVYPSDMPPGSVNLSDRDFQRQLDSGDCHAIIGIKGLEPMADSDLIQL